MSVSDQTPLSIRPATATEWPRALELLLSAQPAAQRDEQITEWLEETQSQRVLDGLWVAETDGRVVGAALARLTPGRSATIWPARVTDASSAHWLGSRLLAAVVDWLAESGVHSAQALLSAEIGPEHNQLVVGGFQRVADLLLQLCFLDKRSATQVSLTQSRQDLSFVPYQVQFRSRLTAILQGTYLGSLDCPVLDRSRELSDVLDGYAAHGDGGTAGWYLMERAGVDAGCVLLAHDRRLGYSELVYMGLAPEARGHGLGRELVRYAQEVARCQGLLRMSLAVDAGNSPAIAVYEEMGFITWERRTAYFRRIEPRVKRQN